tara:strand:+ start:1260 stop:2423 length:1164 start_codon:yes stop_codon:yes gene_type:complete
MYCSSKIVKYAIVAGSFLVGIALCEGLLAFFSPQVYRRPPGIWQFDNRLGWRHVSNSTGRLITPEFDVEIRINSNGLRGKEVSMKKPEGVHRLLVFGDSFAEGWGVREDEAFGSQLEECLSITDEITEVLNFGVAGYGTDQAYLLFQEAGRHYQADDVILLFYGNDLWNNASHRGIGAERGLKPFFRPQIGGTLEVGGMPVKRTAYWDESRYDGGTIWQKANQFMRFNSHLYVLLSKLFAEEVKVGQVSAYYDGLYGQDLDQKWNPVWDLTGLILRDFSDFVRETGARFHLVYVPSIVQVETDDWKRKKNLHGLVGNYKLEKPNDNLARISEHYGISFLDLLPTFRATSKEKSLYFRDSHWNKEGHNLAATNTCGKLLEHGLGAESQ